MNQIENAAQKDFEKDKEPHKGVENCYCNCSLSELSDPRRTREKVSFKIWAGRSLRSLPLHPLPKWKHPVFIYPLESTGLSAQSRSLQGSSVPRQVAGPVSLCCYLTVCLCVSVYGCTCVSVCVCMFVSSKAFQYGKFHRFDLSLVTAEGNHHYLQWLKSIFTKRLLSITGAAPSPSLWTPGIFL